MTAQPPQSGRNRPRDRARTREAILRAAEKIFAEAGLAGARTDAIAAAAGVNKAMLYYYFKSKDGLYRAVLEANIAEFSLQADRVLTGPGSAGDLVIRYVCSHFDFICARPYYPRLFQRLIMAGDVDVGRMAREHLEPISRRFIEVIGNGVKSGEFHPLDPRHAAISLIALTVFYFSSAPIARALANVNVFEPEQQALRKEEVLKFLRHALFRNPEGDES